MIDDDGQAFEEDGDIAALGGRFEGPTSLAVMGVRVEQGRLVWPCGRGDGMDGADPQPKQGQPTSYIPYASTCTEGCAVLKSRPKSPT